MSVSIRFLAALLVLGPAAAWAGDAPPAAPAAEPAAPAAEAAAAVPPVVKSVTRTSPTMDHLELDPTAITGNRELPKVMVIVPWKKADLGDLTGRPANSLLNEVLEPVDREVFRRELRYFEALEAKPET
jgi:hypothetical protein